MGAESRRPLLLPQTVHLHTMHIVGQCESTQHNAFEQAIVLTSGATSSATFDGDTAACGICNRKLLCLHLAAGIVQEMNTTAAQPRLRKIT